MQSCQITLNISGSPKLTFSGASRIHDDVIKWKHFPRYWPFVPEIHQSPVNSLHKGQWRGDLVFSLIWAWINGWVNNHEAGDLRYHRSCYDVTVMIQGNITRVKLAHIFVTFYSMTVTIGQSYKSHNAPVPYHTIHRFGTKMSRFCSNMVYCVIWDWCIVELVKLDSSWQIVVDGGWGLF